MKYRRLTKEELDDLRDDFVQFLASNEITADEWERYKEEDPEKAEELIDIFSDMVFDRVLDKLEYLEHWSPSAIKTFHCGPEKMILYGLDLPEGSNVDLTDEAQIKALQNGHIPEHFPNMEIFRGEKGYEGDRKAELFRMMQEGCQIAEGELFNTLARIHEKT